MCIRDRYVESHLLDGRDVFLTNDVGIRTICTRLRDEYGFPSYAESLRDYVAEALR